MFKEVESVIDSKICDEVVIFGLWKEGLPKTQQFSLNCKIKRIPVVCSSLPSNLFFSILKYIEWSVKLLILARSNYIQVFHAHGLKALPVSIFVKFATGSALIYDAHELETEANGLRGKIKDICKIFEKFLIKYSDEVITVSESISKHYSTQYPNINPLVVRNVPQITNQDLAKSNLRKKFNILSNDILLLYLGGFIKGRGIELILNSFPSELESYHLAFIGSGVLEKKIQSSACVQKNIHIHGSVPTNKVIAHAKEADIGLCLIEDLCLSYRFSLPNKLFEYLLAGIPVVVNDLPEQRKFIDKYKCGWVLSNPADDFRDFLKELTLKEILEKKKGAAKVGEKISWEREVDPYLQVVKRYI